MYVLKEKDLVYTFKLFVCHLQIPCVPHFFGAHWNWGTIFGSTFFNSLYLFTCKSYAKTKKAKLITHAHSANWKQWESLHWAVRMNNRRVYKCANLRTWQLYGRADLRMWQTKELKTVLFSFCFPPGIQDSEKENTRVQLVDEIKTYKPHSVSMQPEVVHALCSVFTFHVVVCCSQNRYSLSLYACHLVPIMPPGM